MRGEVRAIAPLYTDLIYSGFDALPAPGEEVYTKAFDLQLGGGAAAIPITLSRMGVPARLGTFWDRMQSAVWQPPSWKRMV